MVTWLDLGYGAAALCVICGLFLIFYRPKARPRGVKRFVRASDYIRELEAKR